MSRNRLYLGLAALFLSVSLASSGLLFAPRSEPGVTLGNYQRIQKGMTREEVDAIFGRSGTACNPEEFCAPSAYEGLSVWESERGDVVLVKFDEAAMVHHKSNLAAWPDRPPTLWNRLRGILGL